MAIYTVRRDFVQVIGKIWQPGLSTFAREYKLDSYALRNMSESETPTRGEVERWLGTHAGDFSAIEDFRASIGTYEIPWANEDSELTFNDCMWPSDD